MRNIIKSLMIVAGCMIATVSIFADATHTSPATKTYGGKTFLDAGNTPGNAGTNNEEYLNYGVMCINSNYSSWEWFGCNKIDKSNNSYSLPSGATGFCQPNSSSSGEFYGNINFNTSKTTYIDIYITATTEIGFIYQNNSNNSNKWIDISIKEVTSTGSDGDEVFSVGNNGNSMQYLASSALDGSKYYHLRLSTGGANNSKFYSITFKRHTGPAPKSTDATLSDLKVDGVTITGFDPNTLSYSYSVAATATTVPVISATKNDSKASDPVITQPAMPTAGNPTTGTVQVTAEDGTTTKTYTVTFTRAELSHDATLSDIKVDGQSISGFTPGTTSYTVSIPYSQTTIPVVTATTNNSGANAVVTAAGSVTGTASILVTAEDGSTTKTYTLTFQKVAASTDATLKSLSYNNQAVSGFNPSTTSYSVELPEGSYVPSVTAEANHPYATVAVQQATSTSGTATITVTAEDGSTTKTYTIQFSETVGPPVPPTNLLIHKPEKYEAKTSDGGYGTKLTVVNGYEYEVYYTEYTDGDKYPTFSTTLAAEGKTAGISGSTSTTNNVGRTGDTWFEGTIKETSECKNASSQDEFVFATKMIREHRLNENNSYKLHVQGFDQFSLWGMDKKLDPKNGNQVFVVKVDGVEQPIDESLYNTSSYTIRRYDISRGEHVIEILSTADTKNACYMGGFSLRIPRQPKVKYLKGNDSAQVVLQTMDLKKILYTTKYNNIEGADTRMVWNGPGAEGISLSKVNTDAQMIDTFQLSGHANCPVGQYAYDVIAYFNGVETNRVSGTFSVISDIKSLTGVNAEVYQGEEMDPIRFRYYALSADSVTLTWPNGQPQGVSGSGNSGTYVISGIPTVVNTYPYEITVAGADTVIKGKLTVKELNYGQNPVLYLYKNDSAYTKDGTYHYLLGTTTGKWNFITRREKEDGLRSADQYSKYKWILISEDVDADNPEVLALARGEVALPVLNMKSFTYTPGRLEWGEPDNGSLTDEGRYITVYRADHPIFKALNKHKDDRIMVLDTVEGKGLMPINVNYDKTLCLATALTRDIDDYFGDGPEQTIMHEVQRPNGKKYICFPMGIEGSKHLTTDGKKLIDQTIKYLLSDEATIQAPSLAITEFKVGKYTGDIDEANHLITIPVLDKDSDLMKAATPTITLASPLTFVTPNSGETVDFSNWHYGVRYEVRDYTSRKYYNVIVRLYNPQGIDNIEAGTWLNIFDVYGRKVATTNQDIRSMDLPHGMYIVVTESGQTIKIMR